MLPQRCKLTLKSTASTFLTHRPPAPHARNFRLRASPSDPKISPSSSSASMASTGLNVLRYGALAYGVGYGFTHQKSIYAQDKVHKEEQEKTHQESLRKKALQAWDEKQHPELYAKPANGVIEDPDNPKFDLEAYLKSRESSK